MSFTQRIKVEFSVSIPGCSEPLNMVQWIPFAVSDKVLDSTTASHLRVTLPPLVSKRRPTVLTVNGASRQLPACVCKVFVDLRDGKSAQWLRPETVLKIDHHVPELVAHLTRDQDRKTVAKAALYKIHGVTVS